MIRIVAFKYDTVNDIVLTIFTYVICAVLVIACVASVPFLNKNFERIRSKEFKDKYGAMTLGLSFRESASMYYPFVFMIRRFSYALTIIILLYKNYY